MVNECAPLTARVAQQPECGVTLWIEIDDENPFPTLSQRRAEVNNGRRFCAAALLRRNSNDHEAPWRA
jgi:hypothetical protein